MKSFWVTVIGSILLGYFIGCFNLSYFLGKMKGFDIRKFGSGNAGASNVIITMGRKKGLVVAMVDIFKAVVAVKLAGLLFAGAQSGNVNYASCIAGAMCIIGHIFPFYMQFRGGKGLATLGGTILALDTKMFVVLLILSICIALITDYLCFVPISIALIFPASYGYLHNSLTCSMILLCASLCIWYRHIENLQRIRAGEELRFHFLWNRKDESARFGIADDGKEIFDHELVDGEPPADLVHSNENATNT